ncbi:hypothetical protein H310_04754 [Aphanomyces invadans]|uniref:AAA+ ATPase domain-containing protein n=1 Tax=Aphanomyces invadans TaxID=157072 RepID=A0A024UDM1_9STRA|nr:hypothetical protein H310_04754 [Aphanomyces invadans]ETW04491.1 hypothetical protein H310_04754 [Aphanomyces invadans]|eukprot:XP_008867447.1 hypothetical protein H310_04754 [Aphanomyces invadans]
MLVVIGALVALLAGSSEAFWFGRNAKASANVTSVPYNDAFDGIESANVSHSFNVISQVHLQNFEFKYDSIPGRRQLGILASATHKELLRDSIHVYPERHVFTQEKRKVAIQNFHAIDKDALFMHNVGATQVLIRRAAEAQMALRSLAVEVAAAQGQLALLQGHLEQEASAVLVEQRKIAEAAVKQVELEIERAKVQGLEERQSLETKKVNDLLVAEKEHALHKERIQFEDIQRRDQNKELVELQEAASQRMELQRRDTETILKEKQLAADKERMWVEQNTTLEKAVIDVEGRIKQQRLNHDIEMQQLQATLAAEQEKILRALQTAFDNIGNGAMTLLADTDKLLHFVGTVVAVAFGIYLTREIMRIAGRLVEQRLGKPSLVRETSRKGGFFGWLRSVFQVPVGLESFQDVVVHAALETRLLGLARATRNAKKHNVPYRHLLLYGPPGTGKTMVAKRLAAASGMDYAIMSGGDVGPLGSDAVTELHALFRWAQSSPRGVLIFIDEAEAFLGCRATRKTHMSEAMRNALNALLFHTGTQTKQFMLVIATNRPEDLDTAVTDRIDDALHFNLPEAAERLRLMRQYYHECVAKLPGGDDPKCETILDKYDKATDGMSGREIAKMMLYMQNMAYAQDTVGVDAALVERVIQDKMDEHKRKASLKAYKDDAPSTE